MRKWMVWCLLVIPMLLPRCVLAVDRSGVVCVTEEGELRSCLQDPSIGAVCLDGLAFTIHVSDADPSAENGPLEITRDMVLYVNNDIRVVNGSGGTPPLFVVREGVSLTIDCCDEQRTVPHYAVVYLPSSMSLAEFGTDGNGCSSGGAIYLRHGRYEAGEGEDAAAGAGDAPPVIVLPRLNNAGVEARYAISMQLSDFFYYQDDRALIGMRPENGVAFSGAELDVDIQSNVVTMGQGIHLESDERIRLNLYSCTLNLSAYSVPIRLVSREQLDAEIEYSYINLPEPEGDEQAIVPAFVWAGGRGSVVLTGVSLDGRAHHLCMTEGDAVQITARDCEFGQEQYVTSLQKGSHITIEGGEPETHGGGQDGEANEQAAYAVEGFGGVAPSVKHVPEQDMDPADFEARGVRLPYTDEDCAMGLRVFPGRFYRVEDSLLVPYFVCCYWSPAYDAAVDRQLEINKVGDAQASHDADAASESHEYELIEVMLIQADHYTDQAYDGMMVLGENEGYVYLMREKPLRIMPEDEEAVKAALARSRALISGMEFRSIQLPDDEIHHYPVVFPPFETVDLDGHPFTEAIFSEKALTVVNFWNTGCVPCVDAMPTLNEWAKSLPASVQLISVVTDLNSLNNTAVLEDARIIREVTGVEYPILACSVGIEEMYRQIGIPTTIFVDSQGRLVGSPVIQTNVELLQGVVEEVLQGE